MVQSGTAILPATTAALEEESGTRHCCGGMRCVSIAHIVHHHLLKKDAPCCYLMFRPSRDYISTQLWSAPSREPVAAQYLKFSHCPDVPTTPLPAPCNILAKVVTHIMPCHLVWLVHGLAAVGDLDAILEIAVDVE